MRSRRIVEALLLVVLDAHGHTETGQHGEMLGFLSGPYVVIGKRLETDETFLGTLSLSWDGASLTGQRTVDGERVGLSGTIEHPACCEQSHVLRLRFKERNRALEGTYLWAIDLDNYGRVSGYVYDPTQATDWPGMEVLFRDHRTDRK